MSGSGSGSGVSPMQTGASRGAEPQRDRKKAPVNKLSAQLINTYKHINEVIPPLG